MNEFCREDRTLQAGPGMRAIRGKWREYALAAIALLTVFFIYSYSFNRDLIRAEGKLQISREAVKSRVSDVKIDVKGIDGR